MEFPSIVECFECGKGFLANAAWDDTCEDCIEEMENENNQDED